MINVDYLIVGNGLAGTLLAFEMLDHGLDFKILVSKDKSKASLVAAGMFNPVVFKRMTKSWMVDELLPVMKGKYIELERILNKNFFFEKKILKPLSEQEMILWKQRRMDSDFMNYIQSVDKVKKYDQLKNTAGYGIVNNAGFVNLIEFLSGAEAFFRERRYIIDYAFPFDKYDPEKKSLQIESYNFSKIIFCEGYHVTRNYFFNFLPLRPVKGEILEIFAPELSEEFILNKKVFVLPVGDHIFKVGSTYEWEDLSEMPTDEGKNAILGQLRELITVHFEVINHVAGIRPTVSDRRPILGVHPTWNQLYIFNGLGTKGVMLGPYFALEMVKLLSVKNYSVQKEVQIERFINK